MTSPTQTTTAPRLSGSVGRGGANKPNDVLTVQRLLNQSLGFLVPFAPLGEDGHCSLDTVGRIEEFQRRVLKPAHPDARVDPGGHTLEALACCASGKPYVPPSPTASGHRYTNNPHEVVTHQTTPTARDVVQMLLAAWPELGQTGARTLTAQFMGETGDGRYCFNWNLGNVKAGPNETHMYLRNVWECQSEASAKTSAASSGGLAHVATPAECQQHGWKCPDATVVYQPPSPVCRFRAYGSLADGAQRWVQHHQRIAQQNSKYLSLLTAGDVPGVAHALKQARYYTAPEAVYSRIMQQKKKVIDQQLGPV